MNKFKILEHKIFNGIQKIYRFPNEYGASVIKHDYSYGNRLGLWETGLLRFNDEGAYQLTTLEPYFEDGLIGYLDDAEVLKLLNWIKNIEMNEG